MIIPDVNVLVGAFRSDAHEHHRLAEWLEDAVAAPELLALTDAVLGGTLRVLTHPRVFATPTPLTMALDQVGSLQSSDGVARIAPGARHWELFRRLCTEGNGRGNLVADAQHAAVAIEHNGLWVTLDRDFARFPGLRWTTPFAR
ncbi:MAG: type II toxin-antitoxin system VapC family toxin [Nakamurella sp.]